MGLFGRLRSGEYGREHAAGHSAAGPTVPIETETHAPPVHDSETIDAEVLAHLERLTAAAAGDVGVLTPEEFDSALTARLVGPDRLQDPDRGFDYANWFADGVHEILSLDLPTAVVMLPESRLTETGHRVPSLLERGRQNLATLAVTSEVEVERVGDGSGSVYALIGDSPYTASFARFLDLVVRRLLPRAATDGGFVFAIPYRHAIVIQPCSTPQESRNALELVPPYAQALYADGSGPLSPHTFHWLDRRITRLTEERPDGTLDLVSTSVLDHLLGVRRTAG
ncbi:MAG: hypothetical protein ACRCYX_04225 [Dermatophilaceae bacterium]